VGHARGDLNLFEKRSDDFSDAALVLGTRGSENTSDTAYTGEALGSSRSILSSNYETVKNTETTLYIPTTEMSLPNLEAALIAERLEA